MAFVVVATCLRMESIKELPAVAELENKVDCKGAWASGGVCTVQLISRTDELRTVLRVFKKFKQLDHVWVVDELEKCNFIAEVVE